MYAGCLPLLLQLPFFSVMYRLFLSHSVAGSPNALLSHRLLAAPLGSWWLGGAGPVSAQGAVFAGLFVLLAVGRGGRAAGRAAAQGRAQAARPGGRRPRATGATGRAGRRPRPPSRGRPDGGGGPGRSACSAGSCRSGRC